MKHSRASAYLLAAGFAVVTAALAASGPADYDLSWNTMDSGGGTSAAGDLELSGTIGQAEAGVLMTGGGFELTGGYWRAGTEVPPSCPADLDDDGTVGITDFLIVLGAWGTPGGDIDGDGDTGITDFLAVLGAWGPCPA